MRLRKIASWLTLFLSIFTASCSTYDADLALAIALSLKQKPPFQEAKHNTLPNDLQTTLQIASPESSPCKKSENTLLRYSPITSTANENVLFFLPEDSSAQETLSRKRTHSTEEENRESENESEHSDSDPSRDDIAAILHDPAGIITAGIIEDLLSLPYEPTLDIPLLRMIIKRCNIVTLIDHSGCTALDLALLYHADDELPLAIVELFLEAKVNPYHEYDPGDGKTTCFVKNIRESRLTKENKRALFALIAPFNKNFDPALVAKYFPKPKSPSPLKQPQETTTHANRERASADASALGHFDLSAFGKGGTGKASPSKEKQDIVVIKKRAHFYIPSCPALSPFKETLRADCERYMAHSREKLSPEEFAAILQAFSEDTAFIEELLASGIVNVKEVNPEYGRSHLNTFLALRKNDVVNLGTLKALLNAGAYPDQLCMKYIHNPLSGPKNRWDIVAVIEEVTGRNVDLSF